MIPFPALLVAAFIFGMVYDWAMTVPPGHPTW